MINRTNKQEMLMQIAHLAMDGMRYEINNHHTKDISTEACRTMITIHEVAMTLYKTLGEDVIREDVDAPVSCGNDSVQNTGRG